MKYGRGSQRGLAYMKEVTPGITPAVLDMTIIRNTGDSLTLTKNNFQSAELRSDRAITAVTMGNKQTSGGIDFELSVGNFDDFLVAALYSSSDNLVTGIENGITERSFSIEKAFSNLTYQMYSGMHVNTFTINIAADSQITGSVDLVGTGYSSKATAYDPTPNSAISGGEFTSHNLRIKEDGVDLGVGVSLTLNINNNLTPAFALGDDTAKEIIDGRCVVDGTLVIYFDSVDIYNKFKDDTESSLQLDLINVTNGVGTVYTFLLPRTKYTTASDPVSDEGVVQVSMAFSALQDDSAGNTISISKATMITIPAIEGVTIPVTGEAQDVVVTPSVAYTGIIDWSPDDSIFLTTKEYTATITLLPEAGYTLTGVPANFFTVAGATSVTNAVDSGVITAVFPATL